MSVAGKAVFFTDTRHAGNVIGGTRRGTVDVDGLANELASAENGVIVYTSSTGRQVSVEDPAWGNGAFTDAPLEAFAGRADDNGDGAQETNERDLWRAERVKELTNGDQSPTTANRTPCPTSRCSSPVGDLGDRPASPTYRSRDPHPRNTDREMWNPTMVNIRSADQPGFILE